MTRITKWTCDGCGERDWAEDGLPKGWHVAVLRVIASGHVQFERQEDLCPSCLKYAGRMINPKNWDNQKVIPDCESP